MSASRALRELQWRLAAQPAETPVTWAKLAELADESAEWLEELEYEERMGDDL